MKNKKVFYIIMIVILGIFLIGNSIFIISSLRIKDDSKEIETNEEENEEQDEFVASLYNYDTNISEDLIEVAKRFDSKYETSKLLNLNTLEKEITNFNDLDNELKLNLAIKASDEPTSINASTLTDYFQKNFKDKISIQNKDFNCHNLNPDDKNQYHCDYKYDKKTNTYTQNTEFGHGVEVTNEVYSKLIDASKSDNKYTLTYIKAFSKTDAGPEVGFYDNYNFNDYDGEKMADSLLEDNQDATKIVALAMKDVTDYSKYVKYIYTLEEVDGELLLVGYNFQAGE